MNTNEYAKTIQRQLDRQVLEGATSGWMEENATQVIYNGGSEVKIPKAFLRRLGDYDRSEGCTGGVVTCAYETFTLTQDRGRRFRIDAIDADEDGFGLAAANVAAEFQRTQVIPEIDAYRYSKLADAAGIRQTYTPNRATIMSALREQFARVCDVTGDEEELIMIMSRPVYDRLVLSGEVTLETLWFKQGSLKFPAKAISDTPIIPVPSRRMQTEYIFDANGFTPAARAEPINWLICPKLAPIAISKTDNVKITPPWDNRFADAWDVDYRNYHGMIIPDNAKAKIAVSLGIG